MTKSSEIEEYRDTVAIECVLYGIGMKSQLENST